MDGATYTVGLSVSDAESDDYDDEAHDNRDRDQDDKAYDDREKEEE